MMECLEWKAYEKGSLKGFADIKVAKWGIIIKGCKLFMKEGRRWATPPSQEFTDKDGNKAYSPILKFFDQDVSKAFSSKALEAIDKFCKENNMPDKEEASKQDDLPF